MGREPLLRSLYLSDSETSLTACLAGAGEAERQHPLVPTAVAMPGRPKLRYTLLPPPRDRGDPLAAVDLAKAAEVGASWPRCRPTLLLTACSPVLHGLLHGRSSVSMWG